MIIFKSIFLEIFFSIDSTEIQKVLSSISTKTGIAFQASIADEQADIVQVGSIISSPGSMFKEPTAQISPDVHEFLTCNWISSCSS